MQSNKYEFCDCVIELKSEEPVEKEKNYSLFLTDSASADYTVRIVKTDILPEFSGENVFSSPRRSAWTGEKELLYTAYFDTGINAYKNYACRVNDSELYVNTEEKLREHTVFDALHLPAMLLRRGIGILHCSFVCCNGDAVLFSGRKQIGKSTQAALWKEHRAAETVNGDRTAVYCRDGRVFAGGIPFSGTSGICKNIKAPVKAVVFLSQGAENRIERLTGINAFTELLANLSYDTWDKDAIAAVSTLAKCIAEAVPVFAYCCRKDESAVSFLEKYLNEL